MIPGESSIIEHRTAIEAVCPWSLQTCRRLAELDFPIAEVSRHAAREKSIRHGHPSTLHLWWARRPLGLSRAVLMALLMPDPCDPHRPEEFKYTVGKLLLGMRGRPSGWDSTTQNHEGLRQVILKFIADFANWDNAGKTEIWKTVGDRCGWPTQRDRLW